MAEVILSSDDLTILGGPSIVSVDVDFGPTGDRGSQIFVGNGNPNAVEIGQTPKIFDLYINLLSSDPEYLNYYQYQNVDGTNVWVSLFNLLPGSKAYRQTKEFIDGSVTFSIPVTDIVPQVIVESVTAQNFSVQYSVHNESPLSTSISIGNPTLIVETLSLPITIKAIEYVEDDEEFIWQSLSGSKIIDLSITMV